MSKDTSDRYTSNEKLWEFVEGLRKDADERIHPGEAAVINELADELEELINDD